VKKKEQKDGQGKPLTGIDRTTPSIALDFEDALMIGILASSVLRTKAKPQKSTNRLSRS
jgi:hypothetical protein